MSDDQEKEDTCRQIDNDEEINITLIEESKDYDCDIVEQLLDDSFSEDENPSDSSDDSETEGMDYDMVSAFLLHFFSVAEKYYACMLFKCLIFFKGSNWLSMKICSLVSGIRM